MSYAGYVSNTTGQVKFKEAKGTSGFKQDLEEAHKLEKNLVRLLEGYWDCQVVTSQDKGSFSDWDLNVKFCDGQQDLPIEVKNDKMVHKTGNIAVELGRVVNGKWRDTCLSVTKSDAYAYYFEGAYHLIDTPVLKSLVEKKLYSRIVEGGDGARARCALFPKDLFLKHVQIILK